MTRRMSLLLRRYFHRARHTRRAIAANRVRGIQLHHSYR